MSAQQQLQEALATLGLTAKGIYPRDRVMIDADEIIALAARVTETEARLKLLLDKGYTDVEVEL